MHKLHELKEMLCEELEEYGSKGKLDIGSLDVVDKLAHAVKNIDKILESGDYSMQGISYRGDDVSYARGRMNARRDARGRYSSAESSFMADLRELEESAPNAQVRQKIHDIIREM